MTARMSGDFASSGVVALCFVPSGGRSPPTDFTAVDGGGAGCALCSGPRPRFVEGHCEFGFSRRAITRSPSRPSFTSRLCGCCCGGAGRVSERCEHHNVSRSRHVVLVHQRDIITWVGLIHSLTMHVRSKHFSRARTRSRVCWQRDEFFAWLHDIVLHSPSRHMVGFRHVVLVQTLNVQCDIVWASPIHSFMMHFRSRHFPRFTTACSIGPALPSTEHFARSNSVVALYCTSPRGRISPPDFATAVTSSDSVVGPHCTASGAELHPRDAWYQRPCPSCCSMRPCLAPSEFPV